MFKELMAFRPTIGPIVGAIDFAIISIIILCVVDSDLYRAGAYFLFIPCAAACTYSAVINNLRRRKDAHKVSH